MIEYVEGYDELEEEEEEDMEDFYGFPSKEPHLDGDEHGKIHVQEFNSRIEFMHLNIEKLLVMPCNSFKCI